MNFQCLNKPALATCYTICNMRFAVQEKKAINPKSSFLEKLEANKVHLRKGAKLATVMPKKDKHAGDGKGKLQGMFRFSKQSDSSHSAELIMQSSYCARKEFGVQCRTSSRQRICEQARVRITLWARFQYLIRYLCENSVTGHMIP